MTEGDNEHKAFEKLGEELGLDMAMHSLHLLYLSVQTQNTLHIFKAGYSAGKKTDWINQGKEGCIHTGHGLCSKCMDEVNAI